MNVTGGCLVVTFRESPSENSALEFQREVFEESIRRRTEGVIFDVSSITLMDSFMSQTLVEICRVGHILGKKAVLVGLKPAVVASIIDLGMDLSCFRAAVNIDEAINLIHPPKAFAEPAELAEPAEVQDDVPDEDVELEEEQDQEDENDETKDDLSA